MEVCAAEEVESDSLGSRECQGLTMLREGGRVQCSGGIKVSARAKEMLNIS
jgi:hypothetical protein